jgi:putative oxidoreductase
MPGRGVLGHIDRPQTEASAEVRFDTGGRSLDRTVLLSSRGGGRRSKPHETRDRRSPMNTALLVSRIIPGLLLMGHGLQKLVPPGYSPPLLHATGHRGTGAGFESLGIRPPVMAAVLAGSAELVAGFSFAAGLLTPIGTVLVGAVMITAILKVHVSNGIWAAEGGFEFPLVLLTVGFTITALGPGSLSVDSWLGIDNWAGIDWTINPAARSAIALAIGLAGGVAVALGSWASKRAGSHASPQAAR